MVIYERNKAKFATNGRRSKLSVRRIAVRRNVHGKSRAANRRSPLIHMHANDHAMMVSDFVDARAAPNRHKLLQVSRARRLVTGVQRGRREGERGGDGKCKCQ